MVHTVLVYSQFLNFFAKYGPTSFFWLVGRCTFKKRQETWTERLKNWNQPSVRKNLRPYSVWPVLQDCLFESLFSGFPHLYSFACAHNNAQKRRRNGEKQGKPGLTYHANAIRWMQHSMNMYAPMIPPSRYWKGTELVYEQLAKCKVNLSRPFVWVNLTYL